MVKRLVSSGCGGGGGGENKLETQIKDTIQRKLTGVESDINQKIFLSHCTTGI